MLGGNRVGRLVVMLVLAIAMLGALPRPAFAGDRIVDLTTMLSSSSERTRLSAVLSLARLGDKRTMKPLVTALKDPSPQVRAIAATALGKLGHKAALPLLKATAADDLDETVRTKARDAVHAIAKVNNIKEELPADQTVQARKKTTGFGRSPHAVEGAPDLYVTVKGANDDSPGVTDKTTRKAHADIIKAALQDSLRSAPQVTMVQTEAERWGLDARTIDVSVTKLEMSQSGGYIEIAAELRLAISDQSGKMLSFLSGGAKVTRKYSAKVPLSSLRKEALEGAMKGMFDKLLVHLRQITTT